MATSFPMSLPHAPTGFVNQAAFDTAFTTPINDLAAQSSLGYYGDNTSAVAVTLASAATGIAASAATTFTITSQRRVRIVCASRFSMASGTLGRYQLIGGVNSGASVVIGSVTLVGLAQSLVLTVAATAGSASLSQDGTILLAAGTYTAYPTVNRLSGGTATDTVPNSYVAVYDAGSV